jgi:hypothetical protein
MTAESKPAASVRVAVVTDIHHGADLRTKKGCAALALLAAFARFVDDVRPDLVLDLGDRILDRDREQDLLRQAEVAEAFRAIRAPVLHICGNHDRDFLSVADNESVLRQSLDHAALDIGGWRLVIWRADTRIRRPARDGFYGFVLNDADIDWLAGVVQAADRPLLVASHVPVSGHSQIGNYYFERNPHAATYPDAARVRDILRAATVPVAWIAGHVHWNTVTLVDGIPHFTQQSLTESCNTHPAPAGAWGLLELGTAISWQVFGRDPFAFRIDATQTTRRWLAPMPPFGDLPGFFTRFD